MRILFDTNIFISDVRECKIFNEIIIPILFDLMTIFDSNVFSLSFFNVLYLDIEEKMLDIHQLAAAT